MNIRQALKLCANATVLPLAVGAAGCANIAATPCEQRVANVKTAQGTVEQRPLGMVMCPTDSVGGNQTVVINPAGLAPDTVPVNSTPVNSAGTSEKVAGIVAGVLIPPVVAKIAAGAKGSSLQINNLLGSGNPTVEVPANNGNLDVNLYQLTR